MQLAVRRRHRQESSRITWLLRQLFSVFLLAIIVPSGSVDSYTLHVLSAFLFCIALLGVLLKQPSRITSLPFAVAISVALMLCLWILVQATALDGNSLANAVWGEAAQVLGPMPAAISIAPGDTFQSLIGTLLPFAVFATALLLLRSDEEAANLIRVVVIFGAAVSLLGIVQFVFFPDTLLFGRKIYYLESLTAVFVNANTAATYLAMIMIFAAGLAYQHLAKAGLRSFINAAIGAPNRTRRSDMIGFVFFLGAFVLALVALMLTKSRAGISSAALGMAFTAVLLAYYYERHGVHRQRTTFSSRSVSLAKRLGRVAWVIVGVGAIGIAVGGQVIQRATAQTTSDLRFCFLPSHIAALRDHWLVGTGAGTFRDVFPTYRNPACGIDGVLVAAHNFYLESWITLGLPFLLAAIVVVGSLILYLAQGVRYRRQFGWVPAAGFGVLIVQLAHNSVDFSIQNPGVSAIFAALMGATVVISRGRLPAPHARAEEQAPTVAVPAT